MAAASHLATSHPCPYGPPLASGRHAPIVIADGSPDHGLGPVLGEKRIMSGRGSCRCFHYSIIEVIGSIDDGG